MIVLIPAPTTAIRPNHQILPITTVVKSLDVSELLCTKIVLNAFAIEITRTTIVFRAGLEPAILAVESCLTFTLSRV